MVGISEEKPMITPDFVKTMTRYNRWQNHSLTRAADSLSDQIRWQDGGTFFKSIAEAMNNILWDYRIWFSRLQGDYTTVAQIGARHPYTDAPRDWSAYKKQRSELDDILVTWADSLTATDLAQSTRWIRGAEAVETNFGFNTVHMINHQTHHRGQVHALLTKFGAKPDPTDLQMLALVDEV